jgi:hypothetical protein
MGNTMKYILLLLVLISSNAYSCPIGPTQLAVSKEFGFTFDESPAEFYDFSNEISITAPLIYKSKKFKLSIFTVLLNGEMVSKTGSSHINETGIREFVGYVSNKEGFTYNVSFLYGEGRCSSYEFSATNDDQNP